MHLKYWCSSSAGTVNSPEKPPTNQGGGKDSIIREIVKVRIYILEFWCISGSLWSRFFFPCKGTEDLFSFTSFKTLLDFVWSLLRYNEELKGEDKVCYWGTHKPDTLKSVRFKIKWLYLKVVQIFFFLQEMFQHKIHRVNNSKLLCLRPPGICVLKSVFSLPQVCCKMCLCKCSGSGICNGILSALFSH